MRRLPFGFQRLVRTALGLGFGIVVGCFDAPNADVMFSCDPQDAPACPDGYSCEADGCCHRDGTDPGASLGACKLAGDTDPGTTVAPGTGSGTGTSTDTGSTTDTSSSTTVDSSSSSDGSSSGTTTK